MAWDGATASYAVPGSFNQDRLDQQIKALAIGSAVYLGSKRADKTVTLVFDAEPIASDKTIVDSGVAAHDGAKPTPPATVIAGEDGKRYTVSVVGGVPTFNEVT